MRHFAEGAKVDASPNALTTEAILDVVRAPAEAAQERPRDWFGQPPGLTILFLTETWEKFSYYGMRAILVYYMTKQLMFAQNKASVVYGLYTGCAYLTPLIGGPLSDRWLGRHRAVIIGGLVMAAGHFMMASNALIYPALATIAIGNGLYIPNIPAQVSSLYAPGDPRGRSAMNVYYFGINFGAFFAAFVCGTLGEVYGWHYGFAAAGVGMLIGLCTYVLGRRHLPKSSPKAAAAVRSPISPKVWRRFGLLLAIVAVMVIFRACYEQIGNTFALWADSDMDRRAGGFMIPVTWFQSLDPLFVFLLTPVLVVHWSRQAKKGREGVTTRKMAFGALVVAIAYFLLATVSALDHGAGYKTSWLWAVVFFVLVTVGELYILAVGLGLFSRIAPLGFAATAIAIWFSNAFLGNFASGFLGSFWSVMTPSAFFTLVGGICLVPAALLLSFNKPVRRAEDEAEALYREA